MRKKTKRTPRPIAKLLTPKQRADLLIAPSLHLELLLSGHFELDYLVSVAGIFNIAGILSVQHDRPDLRECFEAAQSIILLLIDQRRPPTAEEAPSFKSAYGLAAEWVTMQNTADLTRALLHADWEMRKDATR